MTCKQGIDIATFIDDCDITKGRYIVFENGEVHDLVKGMVKNQYDNGGGYRTFSLFCRKDKTTKIRYVHRVVLEAFKGKEDGKDYVNHIDGDKSNNNIDNLEWVTAKENTRHGVAMGTINGKTRLGLKLHVMPYNDLEVVVELLCAGKSILEIANIVGSKRGTVTTLLNGRSRSREMLKALETKMCRGVGCRCEKYFEIVKNKA